MAYEIVQSSMDHVYRRKGRAWRVNLCMRSRLCNSSPRCISFWSFNQRSSQEESHADLGHCITTLKNVSTVKSSRSGDSTASKQMSPESDDHAVQRDEKTSFNEPKQAKMLWTQATEVDQDEFLPEIQKPCGDNIPSSSSLSERPHELLSWRKTYVRRVLHNTSAI